VLFVGCKLQVFQQWMMRIFALFYVLFPTGKLLKNFIGMIKFFPFFCLFIQTDLRLCTIFLPTLIQKFMYSVLCNISLSTKPLRRTKRYQCLHHQHRESASHSRQHQPKYDEQSKHLISSHLALPELTVPCPGSLQQILPVLAVPSLSSLPSCL
jgi:hypothetical protein